MNRLGLIRQKLYHHYQIRAQTKKFFKCISNISYFYFVLIRLELKRYIRLYRCTSCSYLETHTRFQCFQIKKTQKPYTSGCTYLYGLYKEVPTTRVLTPFMIVKDRDRVLKTGVENSDFDVRLMIQRTGQHNSTKNF